ncbi:MAG: decaprenyl-phosphate phosphoribosyltransferase [Chlorobi bacterium]|nr:decaprenyl-phosphate phosphoribosyltransferase [Chlorobiota bacterium]
MNARLSALIEAARPKQWVKNLVIFAPLLFSQNLFHPDSLLATAVGFLLFSIGASSIYMLNDLADVEKDRAHPVKRQRPVASGRLPVSWALGAFLVMAPTAIVLSIALKPEFGFIVAGYIALNVVYSFFLKRQVILDVMSIAASFLLRIVSGAVIINVPMSEWLLICTSLLALFLGFSKRRHEIEYLDEDALTHRPVLEEYSTYFLDQMISLVTAATLVFYVLYTVSPETVQKFGSKNLVFTIPFVLYGLFRYMYLVHQRKSGGDPTVELLTDKPLMADVFLWVATVVFVIYY